MSAYQGGSVRSIRPFKSSEQYLYAMKEDMAEWLTDLYNLDINVDNFLEVLETGSILCQHANYIMQVAGEFSVEYPTLTKKIQLPKTVVKFNALAQPGTFLARDNVSNFIQWCRTEMDIKDVLMFETEDLVLRKNEKNFVLCLLELARRASRFGMSAPMLIQLEEQIEEEIREELDLPPEEIPIPKPQRKLCNFKNLDQMVQHLVSRCTCPEQFSMIKVSEGKYKVGESNTLIFVRILRNHVMVRVGGGWDTLEHYLDKHDPCRCTSLSHKQALKIGGQPRLSTPVHEIKTQLTPRSDNPNKFQTTLIVSRSQSPLPPVEWRTYTSGNRSFSSSSSTPEAADRTAGRRTPHFQLDQRKIISSRAEEPPSATSRRQVFAEDGQPSQPHISPRSGQEKNRISRFSLVSQQSEDNVFGTSEIGSLAHQGKQAGRSRSRSLMEPMTKNPQTNHVNSSQSRIQPGGEKAIMHQMSKTAPQMSIAQETRPKTPSHFIRPPSPSKVIQQNKIVDSKAKTINTERPLSPTKQVNHSAKQDLSARRSVSCNPVSNRPLTPSSISSNPVPNRVPTPSRNYQSDLQSRIRSMSLGKEQINPHKTLGATRSIYIGDAQNKTIQTGRSTPQTQTNKNGMAQVKNRVSSCTPRMQSRQGHRDSRAPSNLDAEDRDSMLTPLPLDPEEEKALYRSLEDEILSNIRVLEVDSDENNNLESKSGDVTSECSIASNVAVHDFKTNRTSISAVPSITNSLSIPNGEKEVPRSGVYIDAKWPTGGSFDDVISELATGRLKLNKVDVEDWISKISSKGIVGDITETDSSLPCATHERKQLGTGKQRTFVKKKSSFADTKGNKPKQLPSQRARQLAMEARKALEAVLAAQTSVSNQTSSDTCPNEESASDTKSLQTPKPKRSLKKPERVPSIYKLKLRPKIRPRRDNRPEKKPSRIPTPITYRQLQNKSKPKEPRSPNNKNEASSRTRNASQGTSVGIEDLDSDEGACSSELSASTKVTNSMNDHNSAVQNPSKAEDDEESWV